jgi:uncharacterized phage protein (TIGR02216 family)
MSEGEFATAARRAAHLAAAVLGWTPDTLWQATPAELRTALGLDVEAATALDRSGIARLMEAFPDG